MSQAISLTVLDLCSSLDLPLELVSLADRLGYSRYWLGEHFESYSPHGCASVYAAMLAGLSREIRVGTAGILLRYYPAALAAMQFRLVACLYPGRFDAGFCAGMIHVEDLLTDGVAQGDGAYDGKVERLIALTRGQGQQVLPPLQAPAPSLWSLGASVRSAERAGQLGVSYGLALHFAFNQEQPEAIRRYRDAFVANEHQRSPAACLAVAGYCSDSPADVQRVLDSPERMQALNPRIVGTPGTCRTQLLELAERYEVNEIAFCNLATEEEQAKRCLEGLADVMELEPRRAD